jgi:hypothetical protein
MTESVNEPYMVRSHTTHFVNLIERRNLIQQMYITPIVTKNQSHRLVPDSHSQGNIQICIQLIMLRLLSTHHPWVN